MAPVVVPVVLAVVPVVVPVVPVVVPVVPVVVPVARGPGGRPGGPRRSASPPARRGRRRRRREELQPMDMPTYTPEDAPVPEGEVVIERSSTAQDVRPEAEPDGCRRCPVPACSSGEMVTATQSLSDDMIELFVAEIRAEVRLVDPGEEQEIELLALLEVAEEEYEDSTDPAADHHRHGPRRPRQDDAARQDSRRQRG